jgi:hypothetical protein
MYSRPLVFCRSLGEKPVIVVIDFGDKMSLGSGTKHVPHSWQRKASRILEVCHNREMSHSLKKCHSLLNERAILKFSELHLKMPLGEYTSLTCCSSRSTLQST